MFRKLKEKCQPDGYLEWMHVLMLMDGTVLLATSRKRAEEKVRVLKEFCTSSGMMINQAKTQFMAINGAAEDREPLKVDGVTIENCSSYTYLGCIFTHDANLKNTINKQCSRKMCHVIKFEAFIEKNRNAPFKVKEKVWSAALVSSILYGIELWLGLAAIKTANAMYMRSLRTLPGVRKTTTGDLCFIEAGLPSQKKTLEKFMDEKSDLTDDPLMFILEKCRTANTHLCACGSLIHYNLAILGDTDASPSALCSNPEM
jgi:hypothetical protein